jgi:hypothetical protein
MREASWKGEISKLARMRGYSMRWLTLHLLNKVFSCCLLFWFLGKLGRRQWPACLSPRLALVISHRQWLGFSTVPFSNFVAYAHADLDFDAGTGQASVSNANPARYDDEGRYDAKIKVRALDFYLLPNNLTYIKASRYSPPCSSSTAGLAQYIPRSSYQF